MTPNTAVARPKGIHRGGRAGRVPVGGTPPTTPPTNPVAKELVHRSRPLDVLPTGIRRNSEDHFTVSLRWPAQHPLFLRDAHYTPSLVIESVRQAGLLVSHAELGVPLGHQFVVWEIGQHIDPWFLQKAHAPAALELDVRVDEIRLRGRIPAEVRLGMEIRIDGRTVGAGSTRYGVVSPAAYGRLRGDKRDMAWPPTHLTLPEPVDPASVRRAHARDTALSPGGSPDRWWLRADTTNELFFDHGNDHVPAMVLLEAAAQAGHALLDGRPWSASSCEVSCAKYVEFGAPCRIRAHLATGPDGTPSLEVTGEQDRQSAFVIRFGLATPL
ncbi:ScbA/BarX family gamma-butyrolactone biosynthesis protein [Streptomyces sp. WMMC905]|uniref:ScbA/BarX family gamma-butyrolactone biosynthesis protein n=1 Tax=Streptomyces sp. WMMC905 TaxID=3404123 RepID=UPI003B927C49